MKMHRTQVIRRHLQHRGMTLVEVLVTLVLISVGLLGIAALQITTLRNNKEAYVRTQASLLAADILDRMRANYVSTRANLYNTALNGQTSSNPTAQMDLTMWQTAIDAALPGGAAASAGMVERDAGTNVVTVTIQWTERAMLAADQTTLDNAITANFVTRSEI